MVLKSSRHFFVKAQKGLVPGHSHHGCGTRAIRETVHHNVLKDYLERKGGEVLSILMTEYDYATDIAVKQEKAYAEGISIGMERGLEQGLEQGRLEGLERGAYENKLETTKSFLAEGLPPEQVCISENFWLRNF